MKVKFSNETYEAEAEARADEVIAKINGEEKTLRMRRIDDNIYAAQIDGGRKNVFAADGGDKIYAVIEGENYTFEKIDEDDSYLDEGGASEDREEIKPPMPGSVIKVLTEVGKEVAAGDGLIIVEAMKMETTLFASIDGVVKEVNVKNGEQVDSNKVMILVERE